MTEQDKPESEKIDAAELSAAIAEPAASPHAAPELHIHAHRNVRWHVDILLDGIQSCYGFIHEITAEGATLFLEINPAKVNSLALRIHVPPTDDRHGQHIVEVSGKVLYTIHDAQEQLFRTGVHFTHFKLDSDPAFLTARLES